ncbi:MAG: fructosamine kinase family protein, partial [Chloroherpetonaceae bacterium]
MSDAELARALESALGEPLRIVRRQRVSGGCIHHAERIETNKGSFFIKHNTPNHFENFHAEADG